MVVNGTSSTLSLSVSPSACFDALIPGKDSCHKHPDGTKGDPQNASDSPLDGA